MDDDLISFDVEGAEGAKGAEEAEEAEGDIILSTGGFGDLFDLSDFSDGVEEDCLLSTHGGRSQLGTAPAALPTHQSAQRSTGNPQQRTPRPKEVTFGKTPPSSPPSSMMHAPMCTGGRLALPHSSSQPSEHLPPEQLELLPEVRVEREVASPPTSPSAARPDSWDNASWGCLASASTMGGGVALEMIRGLGGSQCPLVDLETQAWSTSSTSSNPKPRFTEAVNHEVIGTHMHVLWTQPDGSQAWHRGEVLAHAAARGYLIAYDQGYAVWQDLATAIMCRADGHGEDGHGEDRCRQMDGHGMDGHGVDRRGEDRHANPILLLSPEAPGDTRDGGLAPVVESVAKRRSPLCGVPGAGVRGAGVQGPRTLPTRPPSEGPPEHKEHKEQRENAPNTSGLRVGDQWDLDGGTRRKKKAMLCRTLSARLPSSPAGRPPRMLKRAQSARSLTDRPAILRSQPVEALGNRAIMKASSGRCVGGLRYRWSCPRHVAHVHPFPGHSLSWPLPYAALAHDTAACMPVQYSLFGDR